jgi:hypothetical protein
MLLQGVLLAALLGGVYACDHRQKETDPPPIVDTSATAQRHQAIRDRTQQRFEKAAFFSPRPDSDVDIPLWMAPLIVQQFSDHPPEEVPLAAFGAVDFDQAGQAAVDTDRPVVYLTTDHVPIGDRRCEQWTYLWFYPAESTGRPLRYRGFRMTLGGRGFAVLWEILSSEPTDMRPWYVSKPLEEAAAAQYGPPLPGRRFAVEPSLEEHPQVVVPRVVGDGPKPMGPFVYLDRESLQVSTLICRCEPSQVDDFPESTHYELLRLADLSDLYPGDTPPPHLPLPPAAEDPATLLRLPEEM